MSFLTSYTLLFELLNDEKTYYSGSDFLKVLKSVYSGIPSYTQLIKYRRKKGLSTSRKDYYYDVLLEMPEKERFKAISEFLDILELKKPKEVQHIREKMNIQTKIQSGVAPIEIDNVFHFEDKLQNILEKIDKAMSDKDGNQVLTLSYTFLEGIFSEFLTKKNIDFSSKDDLLKLAKKTKNHIKTIAPNLPDQTLNLISTITNTIAHARNNFSDSHFANDADFYFADFIRDQLNSISKFIIKFI
ncbi:hypothetical protein KAI58_04870 [Candidatus Gracilibacteria bacterium]|nr:hypothetical protein [Candidatus Gracilibacteria bacterium]